MAPKLARPFRAGSNHRPISELRLAGAPFLEETPNDDERVS